jgi:hypothetical protein
MAGQKRESDDGPTVSCGWPFGFGYLLDLRSANSYTSFGGTEMLSCSGVLLSGAGAFAGLWPGSRASRSGELIPIAILMRKNATNDQIRE